MRYKKQYKPSFLLCPDTNTWIDAEVAEPYLDQDKLVLISDIGKREQPRTQISPLREVEDRQLDGVWIYDQGKIVEYSMYAKNDVNVDIASFKVMYSHFGDDMMSNVIVCL
jgi:hypothetical protein